ncbi:unnamed protein product [Peniophora sp. CBMAI 1063]|nr:unnamed protein product [Peniophora sp. CBMAI 1063]
MLSSRVKRRKALNSDFRALERRRRVFAPLEVVALAFACDLPFEDQLRNWMGGNRILAYAAMRKLRIVTAEYLPFLLHDRPPKARRFDPLRIPLKPTASSPDIGFVLLALCLNYLKAWSTVIIPVLQKKVYAYSADRETLLSDCQKILQDLNDVTIAEELDERLSIVKRGSKASREANSTGQTVRTDLIPPSGPASPAPPFLSNSWPESRAASSEQVSKDMPLLLVEDSRISPTEDVGRSSPPPLMTDHVQADALGLPSGRYTGPDTDKTVPRTTSQSDQSALKVETSITSQVQSSAPPEQPKLRLQSKLPRANPNENVHWKPLDKQKWRPINSSPFNNSGSSGRTIYRH